jgi:photosystem II stability/assembly factor-like uncharacterized protein
MLSVTPLWAQWEYSYYHIPPHRLDDCEAVDSTTFWACGANGYIIKSTDAGRTWSENYGPIGGNRDFYEIDFAGPKFGWAATESWNPVIVVGTTDYGDTWHVVHENLPLQYISDLVFVDSLNGIITGSNFVYRTTDGGYTWLEPDSFDTNLSILELEPVDRDTIWACGYLGEIPTPPMVAITTDIGRTWHLVAVLDDTLDSYAFGIEFSDPLHGWVTTFYRDADPNALFATTDGGLSWSRIYEFDEGSSIHVFAHIAAQDSLNLRVAGDVGFGGKVKRSTDGGHSWTDEFAGSVGTIQGFIMADSAHGLVVGGPYNNSPLLLYYDAAPNAVDEGDPLLPPSFLVSATYPNPFNSTCSWSANDIPDEVTIYDLLGRMARNIIPNSRNITWNGAGNNGAQVSSGYYIVVFRKGGDLTRRAGVKID